MHLSYISSYQRSPTIHPRIEQSRPPVGSRMKGTTRTPRPPSHHSSQTLEVSFGFLTSPISISTPRFGRLSRANLLQSTLLPRIVHILLHLCFFDEIHMSSWESAAYNSAFVIVRTKINTVLHPKYGYLGEPVKR
jgi:hypothetical protein